PAAWGLLHRYSWPGNVGELKSALEEAFVQAGGRTIEACHLPVSLSLPLQATVRSTPNGPAMDRHGYSAPADHDPTPSVTAGMEPPPGHEERP
ncbi:MAG: hypothetical protein ACE5ID_07155, partial [Acidobacteriota bacterium]